MAMLLFQPGLLLLGALWVTGDWPLSSRPSLALPSPWGTGPFPLPPPGVPDAGAPHVPGAWPRAHLSPARHRCGGTHCLSIKDVRVSPREGPVAPAPTRHLRVLSPHPAGRGQRAGGQDALCQPSSLPWELTPWDILEAQRSLGNNFWAQDRLIRALGGLRTAGRAGRGRPIRGDEQISPLPRSTFRNQPAWGRAGWAEAQGTAEARGAGETPQEAPPLRRALASRWEKRPQAR